MNIPSEGSVRKVDSHSFEVAAEKTGNDPFMPDTQALPKPGPAAVTPSKVTPENMRELQERHPHLQSEGAMMLARLILKLPKDEK